MSQKINNTMDLRDQLIAGLTRENELQARLIEEQQNTIEVLKEQLQKFQDLMQEMLDSQAER